jgi:hypothetical protein
VDEEEWMKRSRRIG